MTSIYNAKTTSNVSQIMNKLTLIGISIKASVGMYSGYD